MTNEFAIALLKQDIQNSKINISYRHNEVGIKALELAIQALEQQPSEDCISREEAIRVAEQGQIQGYEWQFKKLCALPSVTPKGVTITDFADRCKECGKQKVGKWKRISPAGIYECTNCNQVIMTSDIDCYKYCHGCGVRMEGEE